MKQIYLDHAATSPLLETVKFSLKNFFDLYGNPSSKHTLGQKTKLIIEKSRQEIAKFINANPEEIFFTSGGTESNNLAILGLANSSKNCDKKHILISEIEHPSINEVCKYLEKEGYEIEFLSVGKNGIVSLKEVERKIRKDTLLVSVMHVNNEIGVIQPIKEIAFLCKKNKVYFHTDAVQSFGKIKIDVEDLQLDLLSVSGHKIGALKGVGFLYIRNGTDISSIIFGGGQERGIRSGTENFLGIASLAIAIKNKINTEKIKKSRDRILKEILKIPGAKLNGDINQRIFNNIHVSFYGIEGESLQMLLDEAGIFVSTGSACSSNKLQGSYVLKAIKTDPLYLNGSIRITIGELKKQEEDYVIMKIRENVLKLEKISPFKFEDKK